LWQYYGDLDDMKIYEDFLEEHKGTLRTLGCPMKNLMTDESLSLQKVAYLREEWK